MIWVRRAVFMAIAVVATLIALQFWGKFSGAMHDAMQKSAAARAPANTNPGEVTVGIIPATPAQNKNCDQKHPCPH
jgi:hypothetical protein